MLPQYIVGANMHFIGRKGGFLSSVAVLAIVLGGAASDLAAQGGGVPAEAPPASFTGNQFVDSNGCAFVRAGIGGTESWVPRVSRSRQQLCGFQPSLAGGTVTLPALAPLPPRPADDDATQVAAAQPQPAPQPSTQSAPATPVTPVSSRPATTASPAAPAPVSAQAPVQTPVRAPLQTSAPQREPTNPLATAALSSSPSPQVIVPEAAPQPRVLTRAQACAGLTGVQPQLISQRTGQPIDCGGETPVQQVASAASVAAPQPAVVPVSGQQRLTRAQACAAMATSGRQYVSTRTGRPLQCDTQPTTQLAGLGRIQTNARQPQQAYSNPLDSAPGAVSYPARPLGWVTGTQRPYSNPLDSAPGSTTINAQGTQGVVRHARTQRQPLWQALLGLPPLPLSNPSRVTALSTPTVPEGHERVWSDGRLNTQRGLPTATANRTVRFAAQPLPQTVVTTRATAPQRPQAEQISGNRYVQVGTFGSRDQAQAVARSLRGQGLPMRVGVYNQQGREMRIVLAGPFGNNNQLQSALNTTRGAGFTGAFTRQ